MARLDYYLGRIGGSRLWVWVSGGGEIISPPAPDSGISGHTLRQRWQLILGAPTGARSYVWIPRSYIPETESDSGVSGSTIRHPWRLIFGSPAAAKAFVYQKGKAPVIVVTDSGINGTTTANPHLYYLGRVGGSQLWTWRAVGSAEVTVPIGRRGHGLRLSMRRNQPVARG